MTIFQQLKEAFILSPATLVHLKKSSISWMMIYFISGLVIFSLFTWQMIEHQETIKNVLLDYFFPESWHSVSEKLANFFFESQTKAVLSNLILSGSLVVASIFLFPIKEIYSAKFEQDAQFNNGEKNEFPLIYQALEEGRLLLLYIAAQSVILWIGYYPFAWTKITAITLSYLFLFFTFGLDIISPTLQRHRINYTIILKYLLKKPILVLCFGLLFSLPAVLLGKLIFSYKELTLIEIASILFLVNILFLTLAIPVGTRIASVLLPQARQTQAPSKNSIRWSYTTLFIVLVISLTLHGQLIASMHHKSQLLKAEYSIDWSSIDYKLPSFSQLLNGKALSNLSFNVEIKNPTEFDIIMENSKIYVEKETLTIATVDLHGFEIPAGETRQVTMKLDSTSEINKLSHFDDLLKDWRVDMHLQVWPGIPFILNIVE